MAVYLIDFENVRSEGLRGTEELKPGDQVVIFYSVNADTLTFDAHDWITNSAATVRKYKIVHGGKNALDFQLSTYLGYLLRGADDNKFYIISKDRGYHYVLDFWAYLCREHHATIICAASISDALKGKRSAYVYPEERKAMTDTALMEAEEKAAEEAGLSEEEIEQLLQEKESEDMNLTGAPEVIAEVQAHAVDTTESDRQISVAQMLASLNDSYSFMETVNGDAGAETLPEATADETASKPVDSEVQLKAQGNETPKQAESETESTEPVLNAASEILPSGDLNAETSTEQSTEAETQIQGQPDSSDEVTFVADIPHKAERPKKRGRKKAAAEEQQGGEISTPANTQTNAEEASKETAAESKTKAKRGSKKTVKAEPEVTEDKKEEAKKTPAKKQTTAKAKTAKKQTEAAPESPKSSESNDTPKKKAQQPKGKKKQIPETATVPAGPNAALTDRIGNIVKGASFSEPIDEASVTKATATFIVEAADKQDFYRRIVKMAGQKSGQEIYKVLRAEYNNLKQLI